MAGNGSASKGNDPSSFIVQRIELYLKDRLMPDHKCNLNKEECFFSSLSSSLAKKKKKVRGNKQMEAVTSAVQKFSLWNLVYKRTGGRA